MEALNQYAQNQEEIGQNIKKLHTNNMTKDSQSRKTPEYIQKRLHTLESLWKKIEENDDKMEEIKIPNHSYYTSNYYLQLQQVYNDALNYIKECQKAQHPETRVQEATEDPEQIRRIKRQEIRIKEMGKLIDKVKLEMVQSKQNSTYEYLRRQLQQQMDSISRLEEDIQVEETRFQARYFEEDNNTAIPLPQIKLPVFDGSYDQWITFYDLFQKIIHASISLTKVEKMQYLKTYLKGEASRIIQHLQISDSNYDAAWTLLQKRYQNNRLILSKLLDKILDLPATTTENGERIKELHDTTVECLQAISNLGIPTESWGPIIGRILVRKWDYETNKQYELSLKEPHKIQDFQDLLSFLRTRFQTLEAIAEPKKRNNPMQAKEAYNKNKCRYCNENHIIHFCMKFKKLTVPERTEYIKAQKLCRNCLSHDKTNMCNSTSRCHICQKPHHTLLHRDENKQINQSTKSTKNVILVSTKKETKNRTASSGLESEVLLATALVKVKTVSGSSEKLRILIDPGSQASFITEEAANLLAHPRQKIHAKISGLEDGSPKISKWKVDLNVQPHFPSNFTLNTTFLILSKLTQSLPNKNLPISSDEHWTNKILADPTYNIPGPIDAIIGAEEYGKIIQDGIHKAEHGLLGQKTEFGWILSGTMKEKPATTIISMINRVEEDAQLKKFWEIEEVLVPRIQTKEDADCKDH
ncbi:uncharacterized protein [Onthophagus taurus]|uniref:uncharacterized protein n=1 Tax=Onthophagus taurus TaxID=166361 RepID=UPI0039BDD51F